MKTRLLTVLERGSLFSLVLNMATRSAPCREKYPQAALEQHKKQWPLHSFCFQWTLCTSPAVNLPWMKAWCTIKAT